MAIIILIALIFIYYKKYLGESKKITAISVFFLIIYLVFMFLYWNFCYSVLGWKYGITGSDMLNYFERAENLYYGWQVKNPYGDISNPQIYGYNLFIYYIYIAIFYPINIVSNLGIISLLLINVLLSIFSGYHFFKFIENEFTNKNICFLSLIVYYSNISIAFTASRILRDILMLYLSALFLDICNREDNKIIKKLSLMMPVILMRLYTFIYFIPFSLYKRRRRLALIISFIIVIFLLLLTINGNKFMESIGIRLPQIDLSEGLVGIAKYILSPDIIDSYKSLRFPSNYIEMGYLPIIYFILSIWNAIFLPVSLFGLLINKNNRPLSLICLLIVLAYGLIISGAYLGANEPRHKLLIILPITILIAKGLEAIYYYLFYKKIAMKKRI